MDVTKVISINFIQNEAKLYFVICMTKKQYAILMKPL